MSRAAFIAGCFWVLCGPCFGLTLMYKVDDANSISGPIPIILAKKVTGWFQTGDEGVVMRCYSNVLQPWRLKMRSRGLVYDQDSSVTIPLANFKYFPTYAGVWDNNRQIWIGAADAPTENLQMKQSLEIKNFQSFTTDYQTIYSSNSVDVNHVTLGNSTGTEVTVLLGVEIPETQRAGAYSGEVDFQIETQ